MVLQFVSGFAQGSPASNGSADLFASAKEEQYVMQLPQDLWQQHRGDICAIRWMDDRLILWRCSLPRVILDGLLRSDFYCYSWDIQGTNDTACIVLFVYRLRGIVGTTVWSNHFTTVVDGSSDMRVPRFVAWESFGSRRAKSNTIMGH